MNEKLGYLEQLKNNMGEEMAEMMSEEITKVMEEQRNIEFEYARLVQQRDHRPRTGASYRTGCSRLPTARPPGRREPRERTGEVTPQCCGRSSELCSPSPKLLVSEI